MTQIALTDDALIRLLESCSFPGVQILSAPHAWDSGFIQRLLQSSPALLVSFLGADGTDSELTELNLDGRWACYVASGWNGADQVARRKGVGAGFDLMHRAAAAMHYETLREPNGSRLAEAIVDGLQVLSDSSTDIANLWIGEISVTVKLPLPLLEGDACYGPLDLFLEARATFDIEGGKPTPDIADVGTEGDVPVRVDLPQ